METEEANHLLVFLRSFNFLASLINGNLKELGVDYRNNIVF